jgi:hypothetical protein
VRFALSISYASAENYLEGVVINVNMTRGGNLHRQLVMAWGPLPRPEEGFANGAAVAGTQ